MTETVLARVYASAPRRVFAVGAMVVLGGLLMYLALSLPNLSPLVRTLVLLGGGLALWAGERQRRATLVTLELTETVLREDTGRVIAPVAQMMKVERGSFAFKPSNGFVIVMQHAGPAAWSPGIWWRIGRRVGVGGVISATQAKVMAEALTVLLNTSADAGHDPR